ncbi:ribonuclease H-like domain-containing protein [Pelagophyceae sp. CCMP2097]|nr:ribonuclease H-like domain-containing protein [Pelagophyceae sp. CCMP2097]
MGSTLRTLLRCSAELGLQKLKDGWTRRDTWAHVTIVESRGGGKRKPGAKPVLRSRRDQLDASAAYCDGSVREGHAGIGVYYADGHKLNYSGSLGDAGVCAVCGDAASHDNNVAELAAVYAVVRHHPRDEPLKIHTDSAAVLRWLQALKGRVFENVQLFRAPGPVLLMALAKLLQLRTAPTEILKVPAHAAFDGNEMADKLAGAAAERRTPAFDLPKGALRGCGKCVQQDPDALRLPSVVGHFKLTLDFFELEVDFIHDNAPQAVPRTFLVPPRPLRAMHKGSKGGAAQATAALALDCEFVGDEYDGNLLASVCVVNELGETVYFALVRQDPAAVADYRTHVSGVTKASLASPEARDFDAVRFEVLALLRGRIVVGHAVHNDFDALRMEHPQSATRDTSTFGPFRHARGGARRLKSLAAEELGMEIQVRGAPHSPQDDAIVSMFLYLRHRKAFDASSIANAAATIAATAATAPAVGAHAANAPAIGARETPAVNPAS